MNGVIYCRVSSKEQAEGTSLESQELACREYARSHNIRVLKAFIEQGESAKFADRTQLVELIDFCRQNKGQVQLLIIWKVDRFARNVADHFNVKATLLKYGVRIVSVTEPIDTNPEGKLMETILAGFAQFDNDIRAMRTVQGMRRKLQEGIFPWKPPLGYRSASTRGEKKTEPDQPDQPLFGLLQKAWREFATGAYTKAEILRLITAWGVTTRKGRPLSAQSTDNLFGNPYYAGILTDPWSGQEHEGRHQPMVTSQEFARVQQVIARRNRSEPHQKIRPEFPLRGSVRCVSCARHLTSSFSRGRSRRYAYYHCSNRTCRAYGRSFPADNVHGQFAAFLERTAPKVELLEKLGQLIVCRAQERAALSQTRRDRVEAALDRLKRESQELIQMRLQTLITDEEFLAQKQVLQDRRTALESSLDQEKLPVSRIREHLAEITAPLSSLRQTWQALPVQLRRRFQGLLLPVGFVNGKAGTAELGLLFRTIRGLESGNSTGVAPAGESWNQILQEITEFSDLVRAYQSPKKPSREAVPRFSRE